MFPTTNFSEINTYLSCPAKLYLKLIGAKTERNVRYTPPSVNIHELGLKGEREIAVGFEREIKLQSPTPIKIKEKKIDKKINFPNVINSLKAELISATYKIKQNLQTLKITITDPKLTDLSIRLKKDYGIDAIIHKVPYTTTPHHFVGEIDFLGLRDNEFTIIEAKNVNRVTKKDKMKLEYYIYGLPKGYNFTKIHEHAFELMGQLYPQNIQSYFTLTGTYNYLNNSYYQLEYTVRQIINQSEILNTKFTEKYETIENFLGEIPTVAEILKERSVLRKKIDKSKDNFRDTISYISKVLSKGVKDGILVNIRDQSIQEANLEIDFDATVRKIWAVKKNVHDKTFICEKNLSSCSRCSYRNQCHSKIIEGELIETKSITSIAHQGISKLNYSCPNIRDVLLSNDNPEEWGRRAKNVMTRFYIDNEKVNTHDLLAPILTKSDWGYEEYYSKKPRWKSLFVDAAVSETLEKELNFWNL